MAYGDPQFSEINEYSLLSPLDRYIQGDVVYLYDSVSLGYIGMTSEQNFTANPSQFVGMNYTALQPEYSYDKERVKFNPETGVWDVYPLASIMVRTNSPFFIYFNMDGWEYDRVSGDYQVFVPSSWHMMGSHFHVSVYEFIQTVGYPLCYREITGNITVEVYVDGSVRISNYLGFACRVVISN